MPTRRQTRGWGRRRKPRRKRGGRPTRMWMKNMAKRKRAVQKKRGRRNKTWLVFGHFPTVTCTVLRTDEDI